jgi:hypothetical protein
MQTTMAERARELAGVMGAMGRSDVERWELLWREQAREGRPEAREWALVALAVADEVLARRS